MSTQLIGPISTPASTGGAGTLAANVDTPVAVRGRVSGIYIQYNDAPPAATTDVTIKTKGASPEPPTYDVLKVSNAATDGWFWPQVQICDTAGAAIAGEYTPVIVHDYLNIAIAQANDGDSVTVWLLVEEL